MAIQALVMGFGGTGAHILTYLKEIAVLKHGRKPESIKFLLVDTLAEWKPGETVQIAGGAGEEKLAQGHEKGTSLDPDSEYYYLQDSYPSLHDYVFELLASGSSAAKKYPHLRDWLHTSWLGRHIAKDKLNIKDGAAQQRQIGRFAMFQNVQAILSHLERALNELRREAGGATVNVWIITSAAGGTGAGSMMDAAFITRLAAARQGGWVQVSGVVVLPDVYSDKPGISNARAYSLFRELDRFQEVGFGNRTDHRYLVGNKQFSSEIPYDAPGQYRAMVENRLFDNLFYLGMPCRNDQDREAFFSSAANAMDPYLDEGQGRSLLEQSVNEIGFAASSFGAARLYVPVETYAELFAWEEAYEFIQSVTAPKIDGKQVTSVYSGEKQDRETDAEKKVRNLLPLFEKLLQLKGQKPEQLTLFAKNSLDPREIVTTWYQFGGAAIAGIDITPADMQKTILVYANPYYSLTEAESDKMPVTERAVKTYQENKSAKGLREDQKASRNRFAKQLDETTQRYTRSGQGTFEEGSRIIFETLSKSLTSKVDDLVREELARNPRIAWESAENGTPMTRLYQEVLWAGAEGGPLDEIARIITTFLDSLDQEENIKSSQAINAINTLRTNPSKMFGTWVEEPQAIARDECAQYIRWYQKRGLLKDMQNLVEKVRQRFRQWSNAFSSITKDLVISQPDRRAALETVYTENITRLRGRLYRLARNRSALISCEPGLPGGGRDDTMQGYQDELRRRAVGQGENRLAYKLLNRAHWEISTDDNKPHIKLMLEIQNPIFRENTLLHNTCKGLYKYFRSFIDVELNKLDIFDYLTYVQDQKGGSPEQVARLLDGASAVLLNATPGALREARWVYKEPAEPNKKNITAALQTELGKINTNVATAATLYSDPNSLTLIKVCKPAPEDVINVAECKRDYVRDQNDEETGDYHHDQTLYRAQIYHSFRAELEAWYIERRHVRLTSEDIGEDQHISPRVARFLEQPDMMQAFVHCIATRAVEKDERQIWVFHNSVMNKEIELTTTQEPTADVMRAGVVFVLRQQEGKQGGRVKITYDHAMQSAVRLAQDAGRNKDEMLETFVGKPTDSELSELDHFLDNYFNALKEDGTPFPMAGREKENLKMVFQFYGDRNRRTHLGDRMELP